jgi:hypothetical protein
MKHIQLLAITFVLTIPAFAQVMQTLSPSIQGPINNRILAERSAIVDSVLWYEDFANGLDGNNPSDTSWTISGADGALWLYDTDGSNGQYAGATPYTMESQSAGNGWMIFDADLSNPGIPAQFVTRTGQLISPYIDLSNDTNVSIKFEHSFRWCCDEDQELKVGVSVDKGVTWENFVVNENNVLNELATTVEKSIVISEIAGGKDSVLIRFEWAKTTEFASSHYFWMIDDVKIIETPEYASLLSDNFVRFPSEFFGATSYTNTPLVQAQATAYFFGGIIQNLGVNDLDSARIIADIESEGFNSVSYGATLASQDRDTLYCNEGFTPSAIGEINGLVYGLDDNNISTDTANINFIVSEYEYARDRSDFNTSFGSYTINENGSEQIGNVFDIYADADIYSIKVYIDEATSVNAQAKVVMNSRTVGSTTITYEDETNIINVGQYRGQWVDFTFIDPYPAFAGQILLPTVYADFSNGTDLVVIGRSGLSNPGETMLQDIDGLQTNGDPGDWYYTTNTPMIRLNFNPNALGPLSIDDNENIKFNIYPNPNNGIFSLQINGVENGDLLLNVNNVLGQEVYNETLQSVVSLTKNLKLSHLEKGIYNITLTDEDNKVQTQKIIIE